MAFLIEFAPVGGSHVLKQVSVAVAVILGVILVIVLVVAYSKAGQGTCCAAPPSRPGVDAGPLA